MFRFDVRYATGRHNCPGMRQSMDQPLQFCANEDVAINWRGKASGLVHVVAVKNRIRYELEERHTRLATAQLHMNRTEIGANGY